MSNVVDSAICSLRKKISALNDTPLIHTRHRMGYVLKPKANEILRHQLTRKLLLGIAVLTTGAGVDVYLATRAALLEESDEALRAKAGAISSAVEQNGERSTRS